jgi:hypothetical protein
MAERRRPGPVPKGARKQFTVRALEDHVPVYEAAAAEAGIPLGDYIAGVLARAHGLPEPTYIHRPSRSDRRPRRGQEELPIGA